VSLELLQLVTASKFRWKGSCEFVVVDLQFQQILQVTEFSGDRAAQLIVEDEERFEVAQGSIGGWDCSFDLVVVCIKDLCERNAEYTEMLGNEWQNGAPFSRSTTSDQLKKTYSNRATWKASLVGLP
jgi:hypothetical protein